MGLERAFCTQNNLTFDTVVAGFRTFIKSSRQNKRLNGKVLLNVSQVSNSRTSNHNKRFVGSKISQEANGYKPGQN